MPFQSLYQFILHKLRRPFSLVPPTELEKIKLLSHKGSFDEGLRELEKLEKSEDLAEVDLVQGLILKSRILSWKGSPSEGLELAEKLIVRCRGLENPLLTFDSLISKTIGLIELGDLIKSGKAIERGETMLTLVKKARKADFLERKSALKYLKGKLYQKKGDLNSALENVQESLSLQRSLNGVLDTAEPLNVLGIIYAQKGDFDLALEHFGSSLELFEEIGNLKSSIKILNNMGLCLSMKGELDQAIENYERSLRMSEKLGIKSYVAAISMNIGLIQQKKGDLDSALNYYQTSLPIFEELNNAHNVATCLNNVGIVFQVKGELDQALKHYKKSLEKREELGNKQEIAESYNNIGALLEMRGDYVESSSYYMQSFLLSEEIGNDTDTCETLYNLVRSSVHAENEEQARLYLQKLQEINDKAGNKLINQHFRLARALVLKMSTRVTSQAKAQEIFQDISNEEVLNHHLTFEAMLNLFELLLNELRTTGRTDVLNEVKQLSENLLEIAKSQSSFSKLAETYRLQAKLALLELDVKKCQQLLTQAQLIAETKGLQKLAISISNEYDTLLTQLSKWDDYVDRQASISERYELAELEKMMSALLQKKVMSDDELPEEQPLMLLILDEGGISIFSKNFGTEPLKEQLIAGFLNAINAFMQEAFSVSGSIERIKHRENTLLLKTIEPFLFCYAFQGQSYSALQKLEKFIDNIQASDELWNALVNIKAKGRTHLVKEALDNVLEQVFV
ncbi:MAG: tetratricopeptide repeat protein [Candidatus Thorarchaeota archaeon]